MAISLKHQFVNPQADGADTTITRPSDWNAEHTLIASEGVLLGRFSVGAGAVEEITLGAGLTYAGTVLSSSATAPFADTTAIVKGSVDATKLFRFEVDGLSAGTTRVATVPDADFTMAGLSLTQTWTGQNTFAAGTLTASTPAQWSQTWNNAGVSFKGRKFDITSTASAAGSLADEVTVDGTAIYQLRKDGTAFLNAIDLIGSSFAIKTAGTPRVTVSSSGITFGGSLGFNNQAITGLMENVVGVGGPATSTQGANNSSRTLYNGSSSTGLLTVNLPSASTNLYFRFVCMDTDGIKVVAATGDEIRVLDKVTAAAGYIQSTTIGSVVTLIAIDATTWVAFGTGGVWTDGTFTYDDTGLTSP